MKKVWLKFVFFKYRISSNINNFFGKVYVYFAIWRDKVWYKKEANKDEFHKSLRMDVKAMLYMNLEQQYEYVTDLIKRRQEAHEKDDL